MTRPFSNLDFWRQGVPKPSEGVTLPSRVRLTPRGVVSFEKTNDVTNSFQSNIVWNRSFWKRNMRVCIVCHHQAIFKAWHLAMGCRRTIGRSDLAKPHQTDTEPSFEERSAFQPPMILKTVFKSTMVGYFWETFHQTLRLVPSPKDIPSLTIGDRFAETDGKERPCQTTSKRQLPQLSRVTTKRTNDENLGGMYF